jgi:hypothetical protein
MDLVFSGTRWPRAIARKGIIPPPTGEYLRVDNRRLEFHPGGKPVSWTARKPSALWRSFPGYNTSPEGALRFIRRHGDPESLMGMTDRNGVFHECAYWSTNWKLFAELFSHIAQDWSPPDETGTSRFVGAGGLAKDVVDSLNLDLKYHRGLDIDYDQVNGWQVRATTLLAFLSFSAADNWKAKVTHRVCLNCGDFFVLSDQRSRFCSGACRTAFSKRGEKPVITDSRKAG